MRYFFFAQKINNYIEIGFITHRHRAIRHFRFIGFLFLARARPLFLATGFVLFRHVHIRNSKQQLAMLIYLRYLLPIAFWKLTSVRDGTPVIATSLNLLKHQLNLVRLSTGESVRRVSGYFGEIVDILELQVPRASSSLPHLPVFGYIYTFNYIYSVCMTLSACSDNWLSSIMWIEREKSDRVCFHQSVHGGEMLNRPLSQESYRTSNSIGNNYSQGI